MTAPAQSYTLAPSKTYWGPTGIVYLGLLEVVNGTTKNWTPAVQSDVASIAWTIYREDSGVFTSLSTGTFTVSTAIKNTLSTGDIWDLGGDGFNVECELAKSRFPTVAIYAVKIVFTLVSTDEAGNPITVTAWAKPTMATVA